MNSFFSVNETQPNLAPWVWGIFCKQFSWFDGKTDVKSTPMPLYEGTWRHDNESWVILREISTCPCFPGCMECEELIPGTFLKQVSFCSSHFYLVVSRAFAIFLFRYLISCENSAYVEGRLLSQLSARTLTNVHSLHVCLGD